MFGSFGVPYIGTEDPRYEPRPVTVPGKGRYVKVVDRVGKMGKQMSSVGAIGMQRDKAEVHNLGIRNLSATHAPDETSVTEDEGRMIMMWLTILPR